MRILYQNEQGGVSVVVPVEGDLDFVIEKSVPKGANYIVVNDNAIPDDREFRSAWKLGVNGIEVDIGKAKEIVKDRVREKRAPILQTLDVEYLKAMESGNSKLISEIAAQKQFLRDITKHPKITNAQTVLDLKGLNLESMK